MKKIAATINETTEITGLSRCAIYRLIREGKLVKRRVNGRTFLLIADLEKFFNDLPPQMGTGTLSSSSALPQTNSGSVGH